MPKYKMHGVWEPYFRSFCEMRGKPKMRFFVARGHRFGVGVFAPLHPYFRCCDRESVFICFYK